METRSSFAKNPWGNDLAMSEKANKMNGHYIF